MHTIGLAKETLENKMSGFDYEKGLQEIETRMQNVYGISRHEEDCIKPFQSLIASSVSWHFPTNFSAKILYEKWIAFSTKFMKSTQPIYRGLMFFEDQDKGIFTIVSVVSAMIKDSRKGWKITDGTDLSHVGSEARRTYRFDKNSIYRLDDNRIDHPRDYEWDIRLSPFYILYGDAVFVEMNGNQVSISDLVASDKETVVKYMASKKDKGSRKVNPELLHVELGILYSTVIEFDEEFQETVRTVYTLRGEVVLQEFNPKSLGKIPAKSFFGPNSKAVLWDDEQGVNGKLTIRSTESTFSTPTVDGKGMSLESAIAFPLDLSNDKAKESFAIATLRVNQRRTSALIVVTLFCVSEKGSGISKKTYELNWDLEFTKLSPLTWYVGRDGFWLSFQTTETIDTHVFFDLTKGIGFVIKSTTRNPEEEEDFFASLKTGNGSPLRVDAKNKYTHTVDEPRLFLEFTETK